MYNFDFLENVKHTDVIFLFHNETENVKDNIIDYIISRISFDLINMYPERNIEESLVALQYPSSNSSEHIFNQFFDSPRCASMMFSTFKGIFVIDSSVYKNFDHVNLYNLIDYIKANSSPIFKFIVLMRQSCERVAKRYIIDSHIKSASIINLEIDKSYLNEFIDLEEYNYLFNQYENNKNFRQLSPSQIRECVLKAVENEQDLRKKISAIISDNHRERPTIKSQ